VRGRVQRGVSGGGGLDSRLFAFYPFSFDRVLPDGPTFLEMAGIPRIERAVTLLCVPQVSQVDFV